MISLFVFDMAGTTVNEHNVVYKTLHEVINQNGYQFTLEQVLEQGAGKEKKQAIEAVLGLLQQPINSSHVEAIYTQFLSALHTAYLQLPVTPMPGAEEIFDYLHHKGVGVALNTGYNQATALHLLQKLNWRQGLQYDYLITASDVERGRPYPDMIWQAMQLHHLAQPQQVAKIGDSTVDIEEGKQAGCGLTVGITTGAHTRAQLLTAQPDAIIDRLEELKNWI